MSQDIAVLCPTRTADDRIYQGVRAYESMRTTSTTAKMIFYVDETQPELAERLRRETEAIVEVGPPNGPVAAWNCLGSRHRHQFRNFVTMHDDATFTIRGWDRYLSETIDGFPNRLGVVCAAHNAGDYCNFPCVSREWLNAVGWLAYPGAFHWCWEAITEIMGEVTQIVYAPGSRFTIHHEYTVPAVAPEHYVADAEKFLIWAVGERREALARLRLAQGVPA